MATESLHQVGKSFDFLVREHGFVVAQEEYDAQHFGNILMLFKSPDHLLKIIVDRGQVFIDIASTETPDAYFDMAVILRHLTQQEWLYDFTVDTGTQLNTLAGILKSYSQEVFQDQLVRYHRTELDEIVQRQLQERLERFKKSAK